MEKERKEEKMIVLKSIWNWLKTHPKVSIGVLLLLAFALGFGSAVYAKPAKTVEKTKIVTQIQDKIVYQDRWQTKTVYVEAEKKHEHTETTETKKPDGTVVVQTKTDTDTSDDINKQASTDATHQMTETKYITQTIEKEKLVLRQPDWRVYAGLGYAFAGFAGQSEIGLPGLHGLVVQAGADRRILGPVFFGISLNTQGTAFANLSVSF